MGEGAEEILERDEEMKKRYGFNAELEHMAIFGTCRKCKG